MSLTGNQLDHYRILRLIGSGGMGEVYLAEDSRVRRQVAAKVIKIEAAGPGDQATAAALRLFLREATAIAQLDHPNILPLYDHGEAVIDITHYAYLIVPYRPEGSLINWLNTRARSQQSQQLTLKQVAHLIGQAGKALQYAHDHQIIHQDIKPANFLIRSRSEADEYPDLLLSDFGIARLASTTSSASQNVRGTPTYMAPEQWAGKPGIASDQYALAIMAYELLTGRPPFQGAPMTMMYAHIQELPGSARELNPHMPLAADIVLLRALEKKPENRFASVASFTQAFQDAFQGMDESTTLRVLQPSSLPTPDAQNTGDIRSTLTISADEAQAGTSRTLTLAGGRTVNVQIPAGAQHGQVLTLSGQGEMGGSGKSGDLYLTLSIVEADLQQPTVADDAAPTEQMAPSPSSTGSTLTPPAREPARPRQASSFQNNDTTQADPLSRPIRVAKPVAGFLGRETPVPVSSGQITQPPTVRVAPPARIQHRTPVTAILLFLLLLLLGASVYGATTGNWPWSVASGQTPGATGTSTQVNSAATNLALSQTNASATAQNQAQANATATAQANVTAQANATAQAQANANATAQAQSQSDANATATAQANANATAQANANATATAQAELTPYIVNDSDPSIQYTSGWGEYYASPYYDGDHHNTTLAGESFSYTFTGVSVTLLTATNSANGTLSCSIDGNFARTISLYSSSIQFQVQFPIASNLHLRQHTVSCITTSSGVYYDVDALMINY